MGLELWSYSNDTAPKASATKRDASAEARSPIRRRNAPAVIRRTIDLRRLPSTTFISPSVRDALRAAEISRRPRSVDVVDTPDVLESDRPSYLVPTARERDANSSRLLLGMELSSRPPRDSYSRSLDENSRTYDRNGATRTTSTGSLLRRARPLRDNDDVGRPDAALIAAARRARAATDAMADARQASRRDFRRLENEYNARNERNWARINARIRSTGRPNRLPIPDAPDFPPLRRMGRRQVTDGPMPPSGLRQSTLRDSWSPTNVDGLGDRERSISSPPSPPSDHWETMLTTITPDAHLPSVDSSFTSAAASASFSTSNTTSQTGTQSSRSASDGSTPTELTEPSIDRSYEEQLICETEDDVDSDGVDPPWAFRRARLPDDESGNRPWATAPSPPARDPSRYPGAHSRLRGIANIIRNYEPSGSRSQSPRSGNDAGVNRPAGSLENDDRRDSAIIVSRPGSTRNSQDRQEAEIFPAGGERYSIYSMSPTTYMAHATNEAELEELLERPAELDDEEEYDADLIEHLLPTFEDEEPAASMEAARARRRAERAAAAERAVGARLSERPVADEI
ncbi:hypothetical protein IWZ01DRAFT_545427 [Phyllosticta capitalensis]